MPIYEYHCNCGIESEKLLKVSDIDTPQTCVCGEIMERKLSFPNFILKRYGKQMALDTLNSKDNGMPDRHWKPMAEKAAFSGVENSNQKDGLEFFTNRIVSY